MSGGWSAVTLIYGACPQIVSPLQLVYEQGDYFLTAGIGNCLRDGTKTYAGMPQLMQVLAEGRDGASTARRGILQPMRLLPLCLLVLASTFSLLASSRVTAAPAGPARPRPASKKTAPAKPAKPMPTDNRAALAEVAAHVKSAGRQQAFTDFTARRPPFFDNDRYRYVVCVDAKLVVVAHGGFPTYVGSSEFFKNATGETMPPIIRTAATKGDGTVRYTIRSDETNNKAENKIGFFQRIKDDVCGIVARAD